MFLKCVNQKLKEKKQSVVSEKCQPVFIARGFLSRKRRNNSLYKILKFYKYLLVPKYSSESITELVTGALGEGNWIACTDFFGER